MRALTVALVASLLLGGCGDEMSIAEKFIDAFYSLDRSRLEPLRRAAITGGSDRGSLGRPSLRR
jgi:hypothetical protein